MPAAPATADQLGVALDPRLPSLGVAVLHVVAYGAVALWLARRRIVIRV
jgi:hypothetical protein